MLPRVSHTHSPWSRGPRSDSVTLPGWVSPRLTGTVDMRPRPFPASALNPDTAGHSCTAGPLTPCPAGLHSVGTPPRARLHPGGHGSPAEVLQALLFSKANWGHPPHTHTPAFWSSALVLGPGKHSARLNDVPGKRQRKEEGPWGGGEGKEAQGTSLKPTMGSSHNKCAPGQVLALWSPPPQQYADRLLVWATGAPRPGPPLEEGVAEPARSPVPAPPSPASARQSRSPGSSPRPQVRGLRGVACRLGASQAAGRPPGALPPIWRLPSPRGSRRSLARSLPGCWPRNQATCCDLRQREEQVS